MKNNLLLTTALATLFTGVALVKPSAAVETPAPTSQYKNALFYDANLNLQQDETSKSTVSVEQQGNRLKIEANGWNSNNYGAYLNMNPNNSNGGKSITQAIIDHSRFIHNHAGNATTTKDSSAGGALSLWHAGNSIDSQENQVLNSYFEGNSATYGGAVALLTDQAFTEGKEGKTLFDNDKFIKNHAQKGGALYAEHDNTTIKNSLFEGNTSEDQGGAIYVMKQTDNGTLTIDNTRFLNNHATGMGGAIMNGVGAKDSNDKSKGVVITNSLFEGNSSDKQGGAIMNAGTGTNGNAFYGDLDITNTSFVNNTSYASGGGAIYSSGDVKIKGGLFKGNISHGSNGGAIAAMKGNNNGTLNIDGVVFDGNQAIAEKNYGFGGAISTAARTTIKDSTFVNNFATNGGGALFVAEKRDGVTFYGNNVFKNNTTLSGKNDINIGQGTTVTLADGASLTLDGGITGSGGTLNVGNGSILNVKDTTTVESNVSGFGSVQVVVTDKTMDDSKGQLKLVNKDGIFNNQGLTSGIASSTGVSTSYVEMMLDKDANNLYTFEENKSSKGWGIKDATYTVKERSAGEVANRLGVKNAEAATLLATSSSKTGSGNEAFDDIQDTLRLASQYGHDSDSLSRAADALVADAAPVVQTRETALSNMIFDAASDALDDTLQNAAVGQSSGDSLLEKAKVWVKGLFNYADRDDTSKARGFDIDTYGVAMGADKEIGAGKVGLGYAYSQSDINGYTRDTDVDTHSLFLYGQYQPADWYVKGVAAYSWSDYEEKKSVLGHDAKAKYDVDTLALQGLYGYNFHLDSGYDITPEGGLRYLHASQDSYTNGVGVRVKDRDIDVWTAVAGVKAAKNFALSNGMNIRPEVRAAVTYDLSTDDNESSVVLTNGQAIRVDGEELDRFGVEFGAKLATDITSNWEVSAGYEGRFRDDYSDHTGMLSAKYRF